MVTSALLTWFALLAAIQIWLTGRLVVAFRNRPAQQLCDRDCPPALAVLCLRGTDPFLPETLRRLALLDYPDYTLRIVVDSETDPAFEAVDQALAENPGSRLEVQILNHRRRTCSGKISGLLAATEHLDSRYGVVAIFDGDATVRSDCLRELVGALLQPGCGIATGNRWYAPRTAALGSLARYFWNAFAVPVMNAVQIPWGGCMALRAESLRDFDVRERLAHAFGEDSTLATCLRARGQRVTFVPAATIANREDVSLQSFANFLVRQLLTVRLCNPRWMFVGAHMLALNLTILLGLGIALLADAVGPELRIANALGLGLLTAALGAEVLTGHWLVRQTLARRGERLPSFSVFQSLLLLPALTLTNVLNLWATVCSMGVRQHVWRGIHYRFGPGNRCTVIDAPPLAGKAAPEVELSRAA